MVDFPVYRGPACGSAGRWLGTGAQAPELGRLWQRLAGRRRRGLTLLRILAGIGRLIVWHCPGSGRGRPARGLFGGYGSTGSYGGASSYSGTGSYGAHSGSDGGGDDATGTPGGLTRTRGSGLRTQ